MKNKLIALLCLIPIAAWAATFVTHPATETNNFNGPTHIKTGGVLVVDSGGTITNNGTATGFGSSTLVPATFADAAARTAATPTASGQLGVQEDNGTIWLSIGTGAGDFSNSPNYFGLVSILGVTSGSVTFAVPDVAGGGRITVDAGTNTFSFTNGTAGLTVPAGVIGTIGTSAFVTLGTGVGTFLATPTGANLASALTTALPISKGGTEATTAAAARTNLALGSSDNVTFGTLVVSTTTGYGILGTSNGSGIGVYGATSTSGTGAGIFGYADGNTSAALQGQSHNAGAYRLYLSGTTGSAMSVANDGTMTGWTIGTGNTLALSSVTLTGTLPQANIAALTGDVTKPSGSGVTTLANIPAIAGTNLTGTGANFTAGSATKWTTGRTIALTGDVTYTSGSLDGSGNVTGTATLANIPAISGANLTSLNATNISSGTLADARNTVSNSTTTGMTAVTTLGAAAIVTNMPGTTATSSATTGALTVGNGTAATNVGIGGGKIFAGSTITAGAAMLGRGSFDYNNVDYGFNGDPNTGMAWRSADQISLVTGGTERVRIDTASIYAFTPLICYGVALQLGTGGNTGISYDSAGVTGFGNGTAGNLSGSWKATNGTLSGTMTQGGKTTTYNNIATVSNGIPAEYATVDLTAQSAAVTATAAYTPAATGMFRVSVYLQITTAGSTSSVLGGAGGVVITYNDGDGNVAQSDTVALMTTAGAIAISSATNTTATNLSGSMIIYARTGVAIQYAIGYTSVGVTPMQYAAHLKVEAL